MNVLGILPFARKLLTNAIGNGDLAIDGTAGNGHDTLFLAKLVGEDGHVFAFDIQETAIENTRQRLNENNVSTRVSLFPVGHEKVSTVIPEDAYGKIAGAIFNLGYLPGGDKTIVTTAKTTITAINAIFTLLKKGGIIVLVIYHGHEEGKQEKEDLLSYVQQIDQSEGHVVCYQFLNQKNDPPFIVAIEKR